MILQSAHLISVILQIALLHLHKRELLPPRVLLLFMQFYFVSYCSLRVALQLTHTDVPLHYDTSAVNCAKASITSLVLVEMTLLPCFRYSLTGTTHMRVDSVLTLCLTAEYDAKTYLNLDAFDE